MGLHENSTKRFWTYVKSARQKNIEIAPLQNDAEPKRDSQHKAKILND